MDYAKSGWFSEVNELWPGQFLSLQVEDVLHHEKSDYQDILVLKTKHHGTALVLDGIIQCTEFDEFSYQEMISFLPLCVHPEPSRVLIVGGGDGGVARDVAKHPLVQTIVQVEIDEKVVEVSKKHLPFMAEGFSSEKLTLNICDGFEYMRTHKAEFDVIITDSSDPVGPAANLFTESYFGLLKSALKPGGVVCSQAGTPWIDMGIIKETLGYCKRHFPVVGYATVSVPTYPCGQIGFIVASLDAEAALDRPLHEFDDGDLERMRMKYYTTEGHKAAFALPYFVKKQIT